MKQMWIVLGSVVAFLALATGGGYLWWTRSHNAAKAVAAAPAPAPVVNEVSLQGLVQALELTDVAAPIEGKVVAVHADAGDEVYEGQLLAEISSDTLSTAQTHAAQELERAQDKVNNLESALASARLEASRAQADAQRARGEFDRASRVYTREKMLIGEGATPRQRFDKAESEFKTLQVESKNLDEVATRAEGRVSSLTAELDNARKQLEGKSDDLESAKARVDAGHVLAPVSGVVTSRRAGAGEEAHPAMTDFFRIATDLSKLAVIVEPAPALLPRFRPGLQASITVADIPNEALSGVVRSVENGKVTVDFANPSPLVKPGHTAQVRIRLT